MKASEIDRFLCGQMIGPINENLSILYTISWNTCYDYVFVIHGLNILQKEMDENYESL